MRFFPLVLNLLLVLALAPMSLTAQPSNNVDAPKPGAASPLVLKAASTNYRLASGWRENDGASDHLDSGPFGQRLSGEPSSQPLDR
jgi:hypothetical protein